MSISALFSNTGHKDAKRSGRGIGAGRGKTAGRGTKGQKARNGAGSKLRAWFEGGQTPVFRKMAKLRGFNSHREKAITVTTDTINAFYKNGDVVSAKTLIEKGILRAVKLSSPVKVVMRAPLKVKVAFEGVATSKSVAEVK